MAQTSQLRNALSSGLQRQNKWRVVFSFPNFAGTSADGEQASILARTTSVPSSTLGVIEVPYSGRILPLAGDRVYDEFPVNFIEVNDHKIRDAFERWSETINGSESNQGLVDINAYTVNIRLDMMNTLDQVTKSYTLIGAFPSIVGSEDLDTAASDSFVEFPVTFRYERYEIAGITK